MSAPELAATLRKIDAVLQAARACLHDLRDADAAQRAGWLVVLAAELVELVDDLTCEAQE